MPVRFAAPLLAAACLAASAQAARVAIRIDPTLDADGRLATAIARSAGLDDWTRDAAADDAAERPAEGEIVAFVTRATLSDRPAIRIVVVDAARGLRLDVDATALLDDPEKPTDAGGTADILGASIRRAIEKSRQPLERLFIVAPAALPAISRPAPAVRPAPDLPVEDAVVGTILARPGAFVREVEHRLAVRPVPATNAAPESDAKPTALVAVALERLADTPADQTLPGKLWIRIESPDGTGHEQSTEVSRPSALMPFAAALARATLADADASATGPTTRPGVDRLAALAGYRAPAPRPAVAAALLELAVADAPADAERRQALLEAYLDATAPIESGSFEFMPANDERGDVERWPIVRDLDARAMLRRRALAHAWQAMAALPRINMGRADGTRRNPLLEILRPLAGPRGYDGNTRPAIERRLAASDAADVEMFARWAVERERGGHLDDGLFAALEISRRPPEEQAAAALAYLRARADRPGLIERAIDLITPVDGPRSDGRRPPSADALIRLNAGLSASPRIRQATYAATMRREETWSDDDRRRALFPGTSTGSPPSRPRASTRPTAWTQVDHRPWAVAVGDDDGGLTFFATRIVKRDAAGAERTLLDVRGPGGEAGHVFAVAHDGRHGYAAIFRPWMPEVAPAIYAFDPNTGAGRYLDADDGVPPCDADRIAFAPLGPGRLFVVAATTSTWMGTITIDGETATTDVLARTKELTVRPAPAPRSATRPVTRPVPATGPTTAEAMDPTRGFVPTEALAFSADGGPPTHVFVLRTGFDTRGMPLVVSLVDRSVRAVAVPTAGGVQFRHDGVLYRFRVSTTRPAQTAPSAPTSRPAPRRPYDVERFDPEAGEFVVIGETTGMPMGGMMSPVRVEGGRIFVGDFSAIYAGDAPTGPFEQLAPVPRIGRYPLPGSSRLRVLRGEPLMVWGGDAIYRLGPTTLPTAP